MEPFLAQIIMFGGNFAPRNWAFCDGTILPINQYQSLYSLLGTTYGGDGRTSFALPDLRSRVAVSSGHGPGLSNRIIGQEGGTETVNLSVAQMPAHRHSVIATNREGLEGGPSGKYLAAGHGDETIYTSETPGPRARTMASDMISSEGGNQAIFTQSPYLAVNYIICIQGLFPSRA